MRLLRVLGLLAGALSAGTMARADVFTITGQGTTYVFALPSSATVSSDYFQTGFIFNNVDVFINNVQYVTNVGFGYTPNGYADLFIGKKASATSKGTYAGSPSYGYFTGPQLYTGSEATPTFLLGTFSLIESSNTISLPTGAYSLDVRDSKFDPGDDNPPLPPAVVPEPSTIALLGTGLLFVVGAARRGLSA